MTAQEAIALLRANPPHEESPLPWRLVGRRLVDANDDDVGAPTCEQDGKCIAVHVNLVPVLVAEVERFTDLLTLHGLEIQSACERAKLPDNQRTIDDLGDAAQSRLDMAAEVEELRGAASIRESEIREAAEAAGLPRGSQTLDDLAAAAKGSLEQVAELAGECAALGQVHGICGDAGALPGHVVARVASLAAELNSLRAQFAAARVAVAAVSAFYHEASCGIECGHAGCDCPADHCNGKLAAVRAALGVGNV